MRIEDSQILKARLLDRATEPVTISSTGIETASGSDRVQLSLLSQTLTDAGERSGRLVQIQAEVQSGNYRVDPEVVSRDIITYYFG
jgi:anti-sigma28 factor (negative regulator of flagellin synthesis)